ncbi:neuroendocrine convertase 1-like [Xenia sp. Carnegie-2017]|uniref:neuroendocrine convertase 1-like n=1 Tax=Xenia sp. Carnegie-2017 TaxID=2897299 RepID=UPI001F043514|nr:neuroendocrine convertase 1-like [Xenia sp. Carnegie-2017]
MFVNTVKLASLLSCLFLFISMVVEREGKEEKFKALNIKRGSLYMQGHTSNKKENGVHSTQFKKNDRESLNGLRHLNLLKKRYKKERSKRLSLFNDPLWRKQIYLKGYTFADHKVSNVWKAGYTGKNITVAVVDSGLRFTHREFYGRYDPSLSYNYANDDRNLFLWNEHGTNCAGVIVGAANNGICGVGIAFEAKIAGIQFTYSGIPSDAVLAQALFPFNGRGIDIFSNSWGPPDTGFVVKGPGPLTEQALENGVTKGRNGRGSIYVFSAGNGAFFGDNCAFNGFVNNIHTIAVAAVYSNGRPHVTSESCSAIMTAAFSDNLVTASSSSNTSCSSTFGQTSAASAMVSGIIALVLQAKQLLTWRDVQHLIARSSKVDVLHKSVKKKYNAAGFLASERVGFGFLDASLFLRMAKKSSNMLPEQLKCEVSFGPQQILRGKTTFNILINKTTCGNGVINFLEHVVATFDLTYFKRGVLGAYIKSPSGTVSKVMSPRFMDALVGNKRLSNLSTLSVHFWGEPSTGSWKISLKNELENFGKGTGTLIRLRLSLYGTRTAPFSSTSSAGVSPCISNPCLNGGFCKFVNTSFHCCCSNGFTGRRCKTKVKSNCHVFWNNENWISCKPNNYYMTGIYRKHTRSGWIFYTSSTSSMKGKHRC